MFRDRGLAIAYPIHRLSIQIEKLRTVANATQAVSRTRQKAANLSNGRDDQRKLWDDVDHSEKRAVGSEEHPGPCRIQHQLDKE